MNLLVPQIISRTIHFDSQQRVSCVPLPEESTQGLALYFVLFSHSLLQVLQQHINGSQRCFTWTTKRKELSEDELRANVEKRMLSLPDHFPPSPLAKQYNP